MDGIPAFDPAQLPGVVTSTWSYHHSPLGPLPSDLHPALAEALRGRGIERLYTHQARAHQEVRRGRHLVVVTPRQPQDPLLQPARPAAPAGGPRVPRLLSLSDQGCGPRPTGRDPRLGRQAARDAACYDLRRRHSARSGLRHPRVRPGDPAWLTFMSRSQSLQRWPSRPDEPQIARTASRRGSSASPSHPQRDRGPHEAGFVGLEIVIHVRWIRHEQPAAMRCQSGLHVLGPEAGKAISVLDHDRGHGDLGAPGTCAASRSEQTPPRSHHGQPPVDRDHPLGRPMTRGHPRR
jgi:hypothetical protein